MPNLELARNCSLLSILILSIAIGCDQSPNYDSYEKLLSSFTGSDLPILVINTHGKDIPDEPKILAQLKAFTNGIGSVDALNQQSPDLQSSIGIEVRGYTSQVFPKKQYNIEFRNADGSDRDLPFLGLPSEADWVLSAPFTDKSLIRNHLAYALARSMGRYAPRTRFVEIFVVGNNDQAVGLQHYRGVYVLIEKIERGEDRVDIEKMSFLNNALPEIAGGYLLELTQKERIKTDEVSVDPELAGAFVVKYPKSRDVTDAQADWIFDYIQNFEDALDEIDDQQPDCHYQDYADIESFADYFLLNGLLRNYDVFTASTFVFKKRYGKLEMGPAWDYDRAIGDVEYDGQWSPQGWLLTERGWAKPLLTDSDFLRLYRQRWRELRQNELSLDSILSTIDEAVAVLGDAPQRNFEKWDILGKYVKANRKPYAESFEEEINKMKDWLGVRMLWMDENIDSL